MLYKYDDRKAKIREALDLTEEEDKYAELKSWVCPFFKAGEYSPCIKCRVEQYDLDQCTEYFLDRIEHFKQDQYTPKFDLPLANTRQRVKLEEIQDIGMTCNSCYMSEKCPSFEKHSACGIDWDDVPEGNTAKIDAVIEMQYKRIKRAQTFELIDGGVPDTNLSSEMDRLTGLIAMKDNIGRDRLSVSIEASGGATQAGGGVLAQLFGRQAPAPLPANTTQDINHLEVKEPIQIAAQTTDFAPDTFVEPYERKKSGRTPPPPKKKAAKAE